MSPLEKLKAHVCELSANPSFIHHQWFVTHHLEVIENLVNELLEKYSEADPVITHAMVWVHDWGKILTNKGPDEEEVAEQQIQKTLPLFGFTAEQVDKIHRVFQEMENLTPMGQDFLIETKIISSADAFSHYVGPFFSLFWYENTDKSIEELIEGNIRKVAKDEKKVLLPEVQERLSIRMAHLKENDPKFRLKRYLS